MAAKASPKIFPHLWYAKEAEEAARFYASIFSDSRVDGVTPLLSESPSGPPGSVEVVDFTFRWQIVPAIVSEMMRDKDVTRSKRVTDALLRMVKLDIAALEKAYRS